MQALKSTWHHIRRSPFQSLAAIVVLALNFYIFTAFFITSNGLRSVLNYFDNKPEITIFLKDGLDSATITSIQTDISAYPNIKEIKFISKEKALEIYRQQNKNNPIMLEMVTANILPASLEISANDPAILSKIADDYSLKKDFVDEIIYQRDVVVSILNWTNTIRQLGIISVSIFSAIAFMIIFVIIGLKITNRKEEIRISRLLGASKFYVQRPFLFEGLYYGLVGSLLGSLLCFLLAVYFQDKINAFFNPVVFFHYTNLLNYQIITLEIIVGLALGYIASYIGVKRYIKY